MNRVRPRAAPLRRIGTIKIITSEHGFKQKTVDVEKIVIPDIWNIAMSAPNNRMKKLILEVWHLAHDMRGALCTIAEGADIKKPIHTKPPVPVLSGSNNRR